ncbi:MAG: EF-P 5-aminopentanol modification-associated protein YfmH [Candidatus Onthomonas sp.]
MEQRTFPRLGEVCYYERLDNGLSIYVVPKPGYSKCHAVFAVSYGGMDRRFDLGEGMQDTPAGIAHYLEHKMFDMKEGSALQALSAAGASPNAFTASDVTAYYFSCTDRFAEHLRLLIRFVSTPYFTPESVQKEQGIIGQEIGMVRDNPDWRVYQNLLRGLYCHHPLRESIIGTVESISKITDQTLYDCHRAFYHPGNMALCVAGDVDPKRVVSIARSLLPGDPVPVAKKDYGPAEPISAAAQEIEEEMAVSAPSFLLGFKAPPHGEGREDLRRTLLGDLCAELLCGENSPLYARLYREGLINKSFEAAYNSYPGAAFLALGGESDNPRAVRRLVLEEARRLAGGIDPQRFQRVLRGEYGARVRSLNGLETICTRLFRGCFRGYHYFDFGELYPTLTPEEAAEFLGQVVREEQSCLSIIQPKGATFA